MVHILFKALILVFSSRLTGMMEKMIENDGQIQFPVLYHLCPVLGALFMPIIVSMNISLSLSLSLSLSPALSPSDGKET